MSRHVLTELKIPAESDFVGVAKAAASRLGSRLGFGLEELDELAIAVTQACESVIDEGSHSWIKLTFSETTRGLAVDVQPMSPRSNAALVQQRQLEDLQRLSHEMIRCFVDDFQTQVEAHRVRISMVKYLIG